MVFIFIKYFYLPTNTKTKFKHIFMMIFLYLSKIINRNYAWENVLLILVRLYTYFAEQNKGFG